MSAGKSGDLSRKQQDLRATTAERLEAIVEAAERAAEGVIDDAEAQARRYLAQARAQADRLAEERAAELAGLVDSLLGQAIALRQEAERLQATLEETRSRIEGEAQSRQPEVVERPEEQPEVPRLRAVEHDEPVEADERRTDAAGARLLATQMAVSGSSREEIELKLRNGFQIKDADAILDAILGPQE